MRILLVLCLAALPLLSGATVPEPYTEVVEATDRLLAKLKSVQPLYSTDQVKFFQEVDKSLAPFIDFEGFAKGVMAKYYRQASDEQKTRFVSSFRKSLVETYAKALVEFDNQKVEVIKPDRPREFPERADISLQIEGKDGTNYTVDYNLVLVDNRWLLRNVVINGINIGLQFRSQFAAEMRTHRNDIDAVIVNWSVSG